MSQFQEHKQLIRQVLARSEELPTINVNLTYGELFLFHALLQDFGLSLLPKQHWIVLLERNKERMEHGSTGEPESESA